MTSRLGFMRRHPRMSLSGIQRWIPALVRLSLTMLSVSRSIAGMTAIMLAVTPVHAIDLHLSKEDGGQSGSLFDFAASARALGMGRAHTAVADDASASYWNPAGLSQLEQNNIVALYSILQEDTGYGAFNLAMPTVDYGTFGMGLVSLRSSGFEKRRAGDGVLLGTYDQTDTGVTLSHGVRLAQKWSVGTSLKVANQKIDSFNSTGYGADAGFMWHWHPRLQAGLTAQNLWAPRLKLKSETETYARTYRAGLKIQPSAPMIIAADLVQTENKSLKVLLGTEWKVGSSLALRGGLNDTELTAGIGLKFDDWGLDYSFGYQQSLGGVDSLGSTHRLGFNLLFGQKVADSGLSLRWQRKGKLVLQLLRREMGHATRPTSEEVASLSAAVQDVVTHQGFVKAQDLYTAQGYVAYLKGQFERSVQSLSEALALAPHDEELIANLAKAKKFMTEAQTQNLIVQEMKTMKEFYRKGDYVSAEASCQKVLNIVPDHVEAAAYLEDVRRRINEPIARELKIAVTKLERHEYLDAIKHLQIVKTLDSRNEEAGQMMSTAIAALERESQMQAKSKRPRPIEVPSVFEVTADPNKSRQLYSQGLMLYSRGKLKEASLMWERAVKMDRDNQLARSAHARVQAELQESGNAIPIPEPAAAPGIKQEENPSSSLNKGNRQSQVPFHRKTKALDEQAMLVGSPAEPPATRFYTVREGDTLGKIADKIYGDASQWKKIYLANRHLFKSKKGVEINQKITLP